MQLQNAESNVQAALAAYENAKIQLGYTMVSSPVSGVIGRISLREGSLPPAALLYRLQQLLQQGMCLPISRSMKSYCYN